MGGGGWGDKRAEVRRGENGGKINNHNGMVIKLLIIMVTLVVTMIIAGCYRDKLLRYFIAINKLGLSAIRYLFIYI